MFKLIGIACVALVILLPFKDGSTVSEAARNEVAQQTPHVLDILAARHPFKIGILRSLLNDNGQLDDVATSYVRESLNEGQSPNLFESYTIYYTILLDQDDFRSKMASYLEDKLGLNN